VLDAGATAAGGLVVGFDNSEPSRRALGWAARQLAPRLDAPSTTLHVVYSDHVIIDSDLSGFGHAEMEAARDQEAAETAKAAADIVAEAGIPYTFERRHDTAADAILAAATAVAAAPDGNPVIVVGRSGHAARHLLGSVPTRLLHHSPYPVLTIP
jgi:nucleotide-binding universal stress UspA family protein